MEFVSTAVSRQTLVVRQSTWITAFHQSPWHSFPTREDDPSSDARPRLQHDFDIGIRRGNDRTLALPRSEPRSSYCQWLPAEWQSMHPEPSVLVADRLRRQRFAPCDDVIESTRPDPHPS